MILKDIHTVKSTDIINDEIEYKEVKNEVISAICGEACKKEEVIVDSKGYITSDLLSKMKSDITAYPNKNLTTIINIGVGQGKTTAIYNLIEYLDKTNKYIVLMVSPYKKLTDKDRYNLETERNIKVVHYQDAENIKAIDKNEKVQKMAEIINQGGNVFITTVNTLFNNPREDHVELSKVKKVFSKEIIKKAEREKKKVIIVFDEFHVITDHFKEFYYHYLSRWSELIERAYILSATFSEASIIATQFITELTNNNAKIYYAKRIKSKRKANLHLIYTSAFYSGNSITSIEQPLKLLVEKSLNEDRPLHIISPYNELSKSIYQSGKVFEDKIKRELRLKGRLLNLLVGNTSDVFDEEKINIGTTFYTAVDIKKKNSILVIIAPSANNKKTNPKLGIFSQGITAITQAIGRIRNFGDVYFIAPPQKVHLEKKITEINYIDSLPSFLKKDSIPKKHLPLSKQAFQIGKEYRRIYKEVDSESFKTYSLKYKTLTSKKNVIKTKEIDIVTASSNVEKYIDENLKRKKEVSNIKKLSNEKRVIELTKEFYLINKSFPRQPEYIFKESDKVFTVKYESYGKDVMPYVLYAAYHNQFANCTLKTITKYKEDYYYLKLTKSNFKEKLTHFFKEVDLKSKVKNNSVSELYTYIEKSLKRADIKRENNPSP